VLFPLCALTAVCALETRARPYKSPVTVLACTTVSALASLGIAMFARSLQNRSVPDQPEILTQLTLPDPLHYLSSPSRFAVNVLLLCPAVALALWGFLRRMDNTTPLTSRWLVAQTVAGLTVAWSAYCNEPGFWIALMASLALLVLAPLVPDTPAPVRPSARRILSAIAAVWFCATLAVTWPHRGEHLYRGQQLLKATQRVTEHGGHPE